MSTVVHLIQLENKFPHGIGQGIDFLSEDKSKEAMAQLLHSTSSFRRRLNELFYRGVPRRDAILVGGETYRHISAIGDLKHADTSDLAQLRRKCQCIMVLIDDSGRTPPPPLPGGASAPPLPEDFVSIGSNEKDETRRVEVRSPSPSASLPRTDARRRRSSSSPTPSACRPPLAIRPTSCV